MKDDKLHIGLEANLYTESPCVHSAISSPAAWDSAG